MPVHQQITGLLALGPEETRLLGVLDAVFTGWGVEHGAAPMTMPPLLPVEDLAAFDYYDNFPHHALVACGLDLEYTPPTVERLDPPRLGLPSAACYAVYLHHRGAQLTTGTRVTVLGRCYRNEDHYDGLRRLLGFHMREIVALGDKDFTDEHLRIYTERIHRFAGALGLPLRKEPATDPFYRRDGGRALMQQLAPVKYEFRYGDLAIASVNVHRNFFGARCEITYGGVPAFTSCVAFGLERWLEVLREKFGSWSDAIEAVEGLRI
ncbi:amino acid--[acyl-carrier-protein] ligase 1 [Lentzea sp. NBRC 105346]|uniref:hypothetical protein n=1 Tax=Lentzea sp. NBRC 105346 TaxID=3032205 RepID=UPI0024A01DFD|nr:hypothetical protein [Lentzea sp. NBRC 105346]GLZ31239.1 amino acid--[acyl-carrier-protein] ligase 1 [Lentzea sp. NBRC 105346]